MNDIPKLVANPPAGIPRRPLLRVGTIVHLCDGQNCAPFIVNVVDHDRRAIGGVGFTTQAPISLPGVVLHDLTPKPPVKLLTPRPDPPTWHWPDECPWKR